MGYCVLALICVVGLFLIRKKHLDLKVKFIVLTVFPLIPFFGYAFNGFGYVTNRWVFGYSFLVAYIAAVVTPHLQSIFSGEEKPEEISCVLCLWYFGMVHAFLPSSEQDLFKCRCTADWYGVCDLRDAEEECEGL